MGDVSFASLFLTRIRSMPNFSSLLGDVTADDVTVTSSSHRWRLSSSSTTEFGLDVITSTSLQLPSSGSTPQVSESTETDLMASSFRRHCADATSTSGVTSESDGVDDVNVMAAGGGDEHWNGNRNMDGGQRWPEQTPNITRTSSADFSVQYSAPLIALYYLATKSSVPRISQNLIHATLIRDVTFVHARPGVGLVRGFLS